MTESFAFSLGKRPIVCILGKRAEETLKVRHKTRKKEGETESESEQIVPFVQRSVLDILEEATATFIFEVTSSQENREHSYFNTYRLESALGSIRYVPTLHAVQYLTSWTRYGNFPCISMCRLLTYCRT
jgi:hypothetical protein